MKIMLIGGGELGREDCPYETEKIDKEIVKMSGKERPKLLFIGLASSYADSYYDVVKKVFMKLGCIPVHLKKSNLVHNPELVRKKIQEADIIYIGGGDTIKLMEKITEYHLQDDLIEAGKRGVVLAGISAGAIALSKEGFSDSFILRGEKKIHDFVPGLGLFPYSICPHYHEKEQKTQELKEYLKEIPKEVYGIENGCALKVDEGKIEPISSIESAKAYYVTYNKSFSEKQI